MDGKNLSKQAFCRYDDDGLVHYCTTNKAEKVMVVLADHLQECGLKMLQGKTTIVYCKDDDRTGEYAITSFDFLGICISPKTVKEPFRANTDLSRGC
ncbi:MAG: hypothetical protein P8X79_07635 [Reinekea sp.]